MVYWLIRNYHELLWIQKSQPDEFSGCGVGKLYIKKEWTAKVREIYHKVNGSSAAFAACLAIDLANDFPKWVVTN